MCVGEERAQKCTQKEIHCLMCLLSCLLGLKCTCMQVKGLVCIYSALYMIHRNVFHTQETLLFLLL